MIDSFFESGPVPDCGSRWMVLVKWTKRFQGWTEASLLAKNSTSTFRPNGQWREKLPINKDSMCTWSGGRVVNLYQWIRRKMARWWRKGSANVRRFDLVGFYGISTRVGCLIPNIVNTYILNIYYLSTYSVHNIFSEIIFMHSVKWFQVLLSNLLYNTKYYFTKWSG